MAPNCAFLNILLAVGWKCTNVMRIQRPVRFVLVRGERDVSCRQSQPLSTFLELLGNLDNFFVLRMFVRSVRLRRSNEESRPTEISSRDFAGR